MQETDHHQNVIARLRRIQGQVGGLLRMMEQDEECIAVLTQIASVRAALLSAGKLVLTDHMRSCVTRSFAKGESEKAIREIEDVLSKFVK